MPRTYSERFLLSLAAMEDQDQLGVRLAKCCIDGKLPAAYVAKAIGVSRMSLYSWFRGKPISVKLVATVEDFVRGVEHDLGMNTNLPAPNGAAAKEYLTKFTGSTV